MSAIINNLFGRLNLKQKDVDKLRNKGRIIIRCKNKLYDVTEYLENNRHPGTNDSIIECSNEDTDCSTHYKFHKEGACAMWDGYYIGRLVP